MIIVGQVSNKQEALEIQSIARLSLVAQRAKYLARISKDKHNLRSHL